ncbi:hypothetical protein GCM10011617_11000 [Novosphingobium arvoryzae]|uniref:Uncharacterized protein n=1 Tax=Novosphingobium arvoryzae TaxID=1256514 RepID=A0A918RDL4_9SPHN|nr:hypothetical protein GCM10011617_11000 [Novosphingobium arvoryzae]
MQQQVAGGDPSADPRIVRFASGGGASGHDLGKGGIAGHAEPAPAQRAGQRTRHVQAIERQDRALARFHPEHIRIVARVGHREHAAAIGQHQQVRVKRLRGYGGVHGGRLAEPVADRENKCAARLAIRENSV